LQLSTVVLYCKNNKGTRGQSKTPPRAG